MGTLKYEKDYKCSDDCLQSGCPGHRARLEYQTTSDSYEFTTGKNGEVKYFESSELETFIILLQQLGDSGHGGLG